MHRTSSEPATRSPWCGKIWAHMDTQPHAENSTEMSRESNRPWFEWGMVLICLDYRDSFFHVQLFLIIYTKTRNTFVPQVFCIPVHISTRVKLPFLLSLEAKQRKGSLDPERGNQRRGLPHPAFLSSSTGLHAPHSNRTSHGRHGG